jgi:hypothetical protein
MDYPLAFYLSHENAPYRSVRPPDYPAGNSRLKPSSNSSRDIPVCCTSHVIFSGPSACPTSLGETGLFGPVAIQDRTLLGGDRIN